MYHQWTAIPAANHEKTKNLEESLGISETLCSLLVQREITSFEQARNFFRPQLSHLHDPFLMKDMHKAVKRIESAIAKDEAIMIYGDYDVDGTTAVSLLYSFLKDHYTRLHTYIPDRYKEGYGVSRAGIETAAENQVGLIIALDCGIKALEQVQYAREQNIDFIICDHHRPGPHLPAAHAILNPKQANCNYPFKELSGCGVGFKLVQALCKQWQLEDKNWKVLLDLLAVSIGADIVPITGENRVLAHFGLRLINEKPRAGLGQLIEIAGKKNQKLTITDVVFLLGPRINAAGRIAHGSLAVEMLTNTHPTEVAEICAQVNLHNNERKELDSSITEAALQMLKSEAEKKRCTTVVYQKDWHKGVIGIVASRLIENHYRPTIVFTQSKGVLAGSARSVKGFDIYSALEQCNDILEQFGGHMYAAGMTLREDRLRAFRDKFEEVVAASIQPEQLVPKIEIDCELPFGEINAGFFKILKQFAPFGPDNLAPVFVTHNLVDAGSKKVGGELTHLRVVLKDPQSGKVYSGIGFNMADKLELVQEEKAVSVAYHLEENHFNGTTSLQLRILDIKSSALALQELEDKIPVEAN